MPKYALYDPTVSPPAPVMGWYDTDELTYPNLPSSDQLLELTDEEWDAHMDGSLWAVEADALVPYDPPIPPALQASMEYTTRVNNGMTIVCTFNPLLDAVYSMLSPDFIKAGAIARDVAAGLGFPGAPMIFVRTIPDAPEQAAAPPVPTFDYPDIDGNMHTFTTTQFTDFYRAMRDLLHEMQIQTDVMAAGGTPVWPSQTMAI